MATLDQIGAAIKAADASGNQDDVRALVGAYRRMSMNQSAQPAPTPSPEWSNEAQMSLPGAPAGALTNPLKAIIGTPGYAGQMAGEGMMSAGPALGLPPEATAGLATVANLGVSSLDPLAAGAGSLIGKGLGVVAQKFPMVGAEDLMSSALKLPSKLRDSDAANAIRTMLDEGINVTKGGVAKLRGKIDDLNNQIKDSIASSSATVNKSDVAKYLDDVAERFKNQVTPQADLATIRQAFNDFMSHPGLPNSQIPVQMAQDMKQGTQRVLAQKGAYGQMGAADVESQKALARGLKEGIAEQVPAVGPLNAQESLLLNTLKPLEKRVIVEAGKNPGGMLWLAHNPVAATAYLADKSSAVKSILARIINDAGEQAAQYGGAVGDVTPNAFRAILSGSPPATGLLSGQQGQ